MNPPEEPRRSALELRCPPPAVFVIVAGLIWALDRWFPPHWHLRSGALLEWLQGETNRTLRWSLLAAAVALACWAIASFAHAGTTTEPGAPERATVLVRTGPFRWIRNPMYLSLTCILIAQTLGTTTPFVWPLWLLLPLYLTRFQILPEERALAARFGSEYADYRQRTGRWLPRLR
jgi:protein-S-isoprenylcysteine O-methyltransferase Ste14